MFWCKYSISLCFKPVDFMAAYATTSEHSDLPSVMPIVKKKNDYCVVTESVLTFLFGQWGPWRSVNFINCAEIFVLTYIARHKQHRIIQQWQTLTTGIKESNGRHQTMEQERLVYIADSWMITGAE